MEISLISIPMGLTEYITLHYMIYDKEYYVGIKNDHKN